MAIAIEIPGTDGAGVHPRAESAVFPKRSASSGRLDAEEPRVPAAYRRAPLRENVRAGHDPDVLSGQKIAAGIQGRRPGVGVVADRSLIAAAQIAISPEGGVIQGGHIHGAVEAGRDIARRGDHVYVGMGSHRQDLGGGSHAHPVQTWIAVKTEDEHVLPVLPHVGLAVILGVVQGGTRLLAPVDQVVVEIVGERVVPAIVRVCPAHDAPGYPGGGHRAGGPIFDQLPGQVRVLGVPVLARGTEDDGGVIIVQRGDVVVVDKDRPAHLTALGHAVAVIGVPVFSICGVRPSVSRPGHDPVVVGRPLAGHVGPGQRVIAGERGGGQARFLVHGGGAPAGEHPGDQCLP